MHPAESVVGDVLRDIPAGTYQCDEIWCFVGKKQRRTGLGEAALGDFEPPRHFTPFTVIQGGLSDSKDS